MKHILFLTLHWLFPNIDCGEMQPGERGTSTRMWLSCPCTTLVLLGLRHLSCCSSGFCPTHSSPSQKRGADLGPAFYTCPALGPLLPPYTHLQEVAMQCECWRGRRRNVWHRGDILAQKPVTHTCREKQCSSHPDTAGSHPASHGVWRGDVVTLNDFTGSNSLGL